MRFWRRVGRDHLVVQRSVVALLARQLESTPDGGNDHAIGFDLDSSRSSHDAAAPLGDRRRVPPDRYLPAHLPGSPAAHEALGFERPLERYLAEPVEPHQSKLQSVQDP